MMYKIAELSDIEATLKLHAKYQIDSIKEELTELIVQEQGLFIAKDGDERYLVSH